MGHNGMPLKQRHKINTEQMETCQNQFWIEVVQVDEVLTNVEVSKA